MTKRRGRPTKRAKAGKRVSLGLRVTAAIKNKIDKAAKASGRSQSQQAEFLIERSFNNLALNQILEILTDIKTQVVHCNMMMGAAVDFGKLHQESKLIIKKLSDSPAPSSPATAE